MDLFLFQLIEKGINPSKIKLCYAQDNLAYQIEKIFKFFRLSVVSKPSKYIEIPFYKQFLEILKLHSSVKEALDCYQKQLCPANASKASNRLALFS